MRAQLSALAAGLVFGAGLALSQMTNPAKVQNFLDVFGSWDASLACVMGAAVAVSALGHRLARGRRAPWLAASFALPRRRDLDAELIAGSAIFGLGWGLAGFCPGPAIAGLSQGIAGVWLFVVAMLVGMALQRWLWAPRRDEAAEASSRAGVGGRTAGADRGR